MEGRGVGTKDTLASLQPLSLDELIRLVAVEDRPAFEEIYRRTAPKLFSVCLRILPREEAEEILQEVYLAIWQRAASFNPKFGRPMTWFITIARNRAVDRLRRSPKVNSLRLDRSIDVPDDRSSIVTEIEIREEERNLTQCLDQLAADDLNFIHTAFFEGATYPDLARRSSLPLGTVKSRVRRALLKLRDCLNAFDWQFS